MQLSAIGYITDLYILSVPVHVGITCAPEILHVTFIKSILIWGNFESQKNESIFIIETKS